MGDSTPERPQPERLVENPYGRAWLAIEQAAQDRSLDPQAAYEIYESHLNANQLDPTVYLSLAITSGGFDRDPELAIGQVIDRNSKFGELARQALLRQHPELATSDIILPSDLGKVSGWSQADYLLFWFHTMTGLDVESARDVSQAMSDSLAYPGFTDKTLSPEDRWRDYARFTDDYVGCLRGLMDQSGRDLQPSNVQAMIMILDGDMSLGGRAEARLCRAIGVPPQFQFLDLATVETIPTFKDTAKALQNMGAQALGLSLNPSGLQFQGVSKGGFDSDIAFGMGFRKTGLFNALYAAQFYRDHPTVRPGRHAGQTPIISPVVD